VLSLTQILFRLLEAVIALLAFLGLAGCVAAEPTKDRTVIFYCEDCGEQHSGIIGE
jgi:hypothetical protein